MGREMNANNENCDSPVFTHADWLRTVLNCIECDYVAGRKFEVTFDDTGEAVDVTEIAPN